MRASLGFVRGRLPVAHLVAADVWSMRPQAATDNLVIRPGHREESIKHAHRSQSSAAVRAVAEATLLASQDGRQAVKRYENLTTSRPTRSSRASRFGSGGRRALEIVKARRPVTAGLSLSPSDKA